MGRVATIPESIVPIILTCIGSGTLIAEVSKLRMNSYLIRKVLEGRLEED